MNLLLVQCGGANDDNQQTAGCVSKYCPYLVRRSVFPLLDGERKEWRGLEINECSTMRLFDTLIKLLTDSLLNCTNTTEVPHASDFLSIRLNAFISRNVYA
ncbi:hypothetical protein TELCIR_01846 [Teladorsagia circumcincta]|uniref:Uncharacterized protein n=1 Tax=Teladorsagia circumcincta TaxID=45464 RepID=A0A2G9V100_TELCI|nr:hypothetical protein TELCIR_01846 [Teladorsagia circumcincta]